MAIGVSGVPIPISEITADQVPNEEEESIGRQSRPAVDLDNVLTEMEVPNEEELIVEQSSRPSVDLNKVPTGMEVLSEEEELIMKQSLLSVDLDKVPTELDGALEAVTEAFISAFQVVASKVQGSFLNLSLDVPSSHVEA